MLRTHGQCGTAGTVRAAPPGATSDDPFGDGEVDHPSSAVGEVAAEPAGSEQGASHACGGLLLAPATPAGALHLSGHGERSSDASLTLFRQGTVCFLLADPPVDALAK
jgi:hypothetical protein